jgi:hypothetical protein
MTSPILLTVAYAQAPHRQPRAGHDVSQNLMAFGLSAHTASGVR